MQQQINKIQSTQEQHGEMLSKMYDSIVGDEFREGIIADVQRNTKHRKNSLKVSGVMAGVGMVLGGLISKLWGLI
jgi:DUF917 family protein